jgi:hypothetical protein
VRILRPSSRNELILAWLYSEWPRTDPARPLVDQADLADAAQNTTRTQMLFSIRANILQELPYAMRPDLVDIEEADIASLYVIPCSEWYLDSGRTFRLADVAANLAPGRHLVDHLAKVDSIASLLAAYEAPTTREVLILNAADRAGPYTIIEGTHRAAALHRNHLAKPNMPWRAILVADPSIKQSQWHIESLQAQRTLNLCAWAVELGQLR